VKNAFPLAALLAAAASACSGSSTPTGPTYYKDVKPLAMEKCVRCHTDGGIAPFVLDKYASAAEHKKAIKIAVADRTMPPWKPGPNCNEYTDDFSLTDAQIKVFTDWVDAGAQAGDEKDYVEPQITKRGLSRVDASARMPVAYTPQQSPDDYRCFLIDMPVTSTQYVTGFRANPGDPRIVHHVIAFYASPSNVAEFQQLDDREPGVGYTCFGGPGGNPTSGKWLGSWAPGGAGMDFAPGTGLKVEPGSKIVLQVHYNTSMQEPVPDQTSVDFKLDATVAKEAIVQRWTNVDWVRNRTMNIPAGMADVVHSFEFDPTTVFGFISNNVIPSGVPLTIYSSALHMHTRGVSARFDIRRGGDKAKTECMLDIPNWDFHWQGSYPFKTPKTFQPGDTLYLECHHDNAKGTTELNWGEGTGDEMCLGVFYVTTAN